MMNCRFSVVALYALLLCGFLVPRVSCENYDPFCSTEPSRPSNYSDPVLKLAEKREHILYASEMNIGHTIHSAYKMIVTSDSSINKICDDIDSIYLPVSTDPYVLPFVTMQLYENETTGLPLDQNTTIDQVNTYFDAPGTDTAIRAWFEFLKTKMLDETWPDGVSGLTRFRFYNEVNLPEWNLPGPETMMQIFLRVIPLFNAHYKNGNEFSDANICLSLAGSTPEEVTPYLQRMLSYYREYGEGAEFPITGIDIHVQDNPARMINGLRAAFISELDNGSDTFDSLFIMVYEGNFHPVGNCEHFGVSYMSDRGRASHGIKTMTELLSFPNVQMATIGYRFGGGWSPKNPTGWFNLAGLQNSGKDAFDRGMGFASPALESLRIYTHYLRNIRPDSNNIADEFRVYRFRSDATAETGAMLVWRDWYTEPAPITMEVPEEWRRYDTVFGIDLVNFPDEWFEIDLEGTPPSITVTAGENPILIVPTLGTPHTGNYIRSYMFPDIRNKRDIVPYGDADWTSTLLLSNPTDDAVTVKLTPYDKTGAMDENNIIPLTLGGRATWQRTLDDLELPDFRGSIVIESTGALSGYVNYAYFAGPGIKSASAGIQRVQLTDPVFGWDYYLSQDWSVYPDPYYPLLNNIILVNPQYFNVTGTMYLYDKSGIPVKTINLSLADGAQYTYLIDPRLTGDNKGKVEVVTFAPLNGQISKYIANSSHQIHSKWTEEPFVPDTKMVSKSKLTLTDPSIESAGLILTNPWGTELTGELQSVDYSTGDIQTEVFVLAPHETVEIMGDSSVEDELSVDFSESAKTFTRIEKTMSVDPGDPDNTVISSHAVVPDTGFHTLHLAYYRFDTRADQREETVVILRNTSADNVGIGFLAFDMEGSPLYLENDGINLDPGESVTLSLAALFPVDVTLGEGSMSITASQIDALDSDVIYTFYESEPGVNYSFTGELVPVSE